MTKIQIAFYVPDEMSTYTWNNSVQTKLDVELEVEVGVRSGRWST